MTCWPESRAPNARDAPEHHCGNRNLTTSARIRAARKARTLRRRDHPPKSPARSADEREREEGDAKSNAMYVLPKAAIKSQCATDGAVDIPEGDDENA